MIQAGILILTLCGLATAQPSADRPADLRGARALLRSVDRAFLRGSKQDPLDFIRVNAKTIERLYGLEGAPAEAREEACAWLRRRVIHARGAGGQRFRWRVLAIDLIGRLSEDVHWVRYLVRLAGRSDSSNGGGLDLYVERALGAIRSPAQVRWLMERARTGRADVAALALAGLSRIERPELVALIGPLLPHLRDLVSGRDGPVAARAVDVLSRLGTPEALATLITGARAADPLVRRAVARALALRLSAPGVQSVLGRLLSDTHPRVREDAARALGRSRTRGPVPLLIQRLDKEPLRSRTTIARSLRLLTGVMLPPEPAPWRQWLAASTADGRADPEKEAGGAAPPVRTTYAVPSYHGFSVNSDRVVFAIDVSRSMGVMTGSRTRLGAAMAGLTAALQALDRDTRFGIIVFGDSALAYERDLVRATASNVADALEWVGRQAPRGATNTYGALRLAFNRYREMDTLFVLSDGIPTAGTTTVHERILRDLVTWNGVRDVRVNTVALLSGRVPEDRGSAGAREGALRFLQELAEVTEGDFLVLR